MANTATTDNLAEVQNIIISKMRYTAENNAPCQHLIERFTLPSGAKQFTVPKCGQVSAADVTDGVDITDEQSISITTTDLTCAEVGLKFIVTDKLVRQSDPGVFEMVGRMAGDAMARKRDTDIIALFSALNGGTTLGADGHNLSQNNAAVIVAATRGYYGRGPLPNPVYCVHHPNALHYLVKDSAGVNATYVQGVLSSYQAEFLADFWKIKISGVNFFEDGNITKISGYDSGYGAIFSKSAMAIVVGKEVYTEQERDASLRATELVTVSDYGVFELDDTYGFPAQFEIGNPSTA